MFWGPILTKSGVPMDNCSLSPTHFFEFMVKQSKAVAQNVWSLTQARGIKDKVWVAESEDQVSKAQA